MNLIDKLRQRIATRQKTAAEDYWAGVKRLARGGLSDKDEAAALAPVEQLLPAMQRTADDLAADVSAFGEAIASEKAEAAAAKSVAAAKSLAVEVGALTARAEAAKAEADRLFAEVENLRHRAHSETMASREVMRVAREARRRLGERGCPEFADAVPPTSGYAQVGGAE